MTKQYIDVGKVSGIFGVKGWLKVFSFTQPRENILSYSPWRLVKGADVIEIEVIDGQLHGKSIIASLKNINDRDAATNLLGYKIQIDTDLLLELEEDEYYWHQLVGLEVENKQNISLGRVDSILETGANDVLVVKGDRERLIPFLQQHTVLNIDLDAKKMLVDWDADF